jgi:hypothetical protein
MRLQASGFRLQEGCGGKAAAIENRKSTIDNPGWMVLLLASALSLRAEAQWKIPAALAVGEMAVLELVETDATKPPLLRPPLEERIGTLRLRSVDPSKDGRGWRIQVLPLGPGTSVIPAMDLGDGRKTPELRLTAPRTVPFGGPWMGLGGGPEDQLPELPFPWAWATLLLVPFLALGWLLYANWRKGSVRRARKHALRAFARAWPPRSRERAALDLAHDAGREVLARHFGEQARSWGAQQLHQQNLHPWDLWAASLDAARFARSEPPFPALDGLLRRLDPRRPAAPRQGDQ